MEQADALETADQLKLRGQIVAGKYELLEQLGQGGMGFVYKAKHIQLGKLCAVKLMNPNSWGLDRKDIARFQREAKTASGLNHQNLVSITDFGTADNEAPYLVMDLVEGQSLSDLLKSGALSEADALSVAVQLCDGIEFAHNKGIIHRDLKPSNIMIERTPKGMVPRILDFGIAKSLNESDEPGKRTLTQTGEMIGSPQYMSPEQCGGYQLDARTDIYSLGCVLYEMLAGRPVFEADSVMGLMMQHLNEQPKLFRALPSAPRIRPELERVVMQMLEKDRDSRYQNIDDVQKDLRLVQSGKNPVKEFSQARKRMKLIARACKIGLLVLMLPLLVWLGICGVSSYLYASRAPWTDAQYQAVRMVQSTKTPYEADAAYSKAIKIAEGAHATPDQLMNLLLSQATLRSSYEHDPAGSLRALQKASPLLPNVKSLHLKAQYYDEYSTDFEDIKDWQRALQSAETAVAIKRQLRKDDPKFNVTFSAHSLMHLFKAQRHLKRYAEAQKTIDEAIELLKTISPTPELADSTLDLARILNDQGKLDEAIQQAEQADRISDDVRGPDIQPSVQIKTFLEELRRRKHGSLPTS